MDWTSGCLRGCHSEEKDKWGSEQHRHEEGKNPSQPPGDYSLCGFLAAHSVLLSLWTQHTNHPLGELVQPPSVPVCFHGAPPLPRPHQQVDRDPISTLPGLGDWFRAEPGTSGPQLFSDRCGERSSLFLKGGEKGTESCGSLVSMMPAQGKPHRDTKS